ncbi:MAG: non-heme iron oxygenase ferredoxin subunit [Fulvimonas sp.]|nr:non-heme iron oxygenase ferredoxin subunit [Fulvimonas sp.]
MSSQASYRFIAHTADVPADRALAVVLPGYPPLAVARLGDAFFVMDDTCTHGAALLSDGEIIDGEIECPFHAGRFDIRTGEATAFPCTKALRVYPTRVEGGAVLADLDGQGTGTDCAGSCNQAATA